MSLFTIKSQIRETKEKFVTEEVCVTKNFKKVESERRQFKSVKFSSNIVAPKSEKPCKSFVSILSVDLNVPYIDQSPVLLRNENLTVKKVATTQSEIKSDPYEHLFALNSKWIIGNKIYKVAN